MKRIEIALAVVVVILARSVSGGCFGQQPAQTDPGQIGTPKPPQRPVTFTQRMKQLLSRTGATIDDSRGGPELVVSIYPDQKGGKTTIVLVNDRRRNLLGFYVYNFGNVKDVKNKEEVYRYLLNANDAISIGTFFVDSEDDIGYKYLVNNQTAFSQAAFEFVYYAMASVASERKPEIRKALGLPPIKEEAPSEVKKAAEEKPPKQ
jgi:hypothetical protein